MPSMLIPDAAALRAALDLLGRRLSDLGLEAEIVVIGGGALLLTGLTTRSTKDVDIVALMKGKELVSPDALPALFFEAAREVSQEYRFEPDWMNTGPKELLRHGLPAGFVRRCMTFRFHALTLQVADRFDQIHLKLYAATDSGPESRHFRDLLGLQPTSAELLSAGRWCLTHDPSPGFRGFLLQAMQRAGWEGQNEELN